jgi:6-phosphogluconolactonase
LGLAVGPEAPSGRFLCASESGTGGIRTYSIAANGTLTDVTGAAAVGAGTLLAGALVFHPSGAFLYSSGGGVDAWHVDVATGALSPVEGSPFRADVASDPQATDIAFDSTGRFAYATDFATDHLTVFDVDAAAGSLSARPATHATPSPYSVAVAPSGRFVFVGNDDANEFSIFLVDPATGALTPSQGSPFPGTGLQPEAVIVRLQ